MIKKNPITKNTKKPTSGKLKLGARETFIKQEKKSYYSKIKKDPYLEKEEEVADEVYESERELVKKIGYGPRFGGGLKGAQIYVDRIVRSAQWQNFSSGVTKIKLYNYDNPEFRQILKENHDQDTVGSGDVLAIAALTSNSEICAIGLKPRNRQALSHVVILHEMAHIAKAPFDHAEDFQRAYLTLLRTFLPKTVNKDKIIKFLTEEFKDRGLSTKLFDLGKVAGSKEKLLLNKSKVKKKKSR